MHLQSVSVYVRDQERALDFYTDVFGFESLVDVAIDDDADDRWIELGLPGDTVRLVLSTASTAEHFDQSVGGWTNIIFSVDDVEAAVREMEEAGATVVEEPQSFNWGEWAVVGDPDGNQFGLSASSVEQEE